MVVEAGKYKQHPQEQKHITESNTARQEWTLPKSDPSKFQNDDDNVYMFMWHEGIATRGAHEVSYCMKRFVQNNMQPEFRPVCSPR